jgi:type II secretory ATPase GspE/PulE/Tfp pilus assembly ATPase PilB-like protein
MAFSPLYCSGLLWVVATAEPWNEMYLRQLRKAVEKEIRFVGISETDFDRTIAILTAESGISNQGVRPVVLPQESEAPFETWDIREDNYRATVREMVEKAYRMQVSDIILDPMEDRLSVRFRIHGRLEVMPPIELSNERALWKSN